MTSPDFTYPQPTDSELRAQQPGDDDLHQKPHTPALGTSDSEVAQAAWAAQAPQTPQQSQRLGRVALGLAIAAAGLSLLASIVLGLTVGPIEADYGSTIAEAPDWVGSLALALMGLQAVLTGVGITALVVGMVAAALHRGRVLGIVATIIAVLAPVVSFGVYIVLSFAAL